MKGNLALNHWQYLLNNRTMANTSDLIGTEVDIQEACGGTLVIVKSDLSDANNDVLDLEVWTSCSDHSGAMLVSGTSKTATTNTVKATLTSDADNFVAWSTTQTTGLYSRTISSNKLATLDAAGIYVLNVPDLRRYVNIQFTGTGVKSKLTAILIANGLADAPKRAARTAYVDSDQ